MQESAVALSGIKNIPGRFEMYRSSLLKPMVVVDYAHTPSALEVVLKAVRRLTKHHVWVIFGCGGNRDKGKRALMGQVAERLADRVLLTSDNSRFEDTDVIIADILKGMICPWAVEIEVDRAEAIKRVISEAKVGDVVLVAGKGHEAYQISKNKKTDFSDKVHVLNALGITEMA
jgi:UDP-N-acetylmuramoyl-L-alanyl-D-glutamate--2,6-diaminopimelate ligase